MSFPELRRRPAGVTGALKHKATADLVPNGEAFSLVCCISTTPVPLLTIKVNVCLAPARSVCDNAYATTAR